MNVNLGKHFEEMIRAKVESGLYANASEVVREALRRFEADEEKRARLREKIAVAEAQFERGEGIEITDLKAYFDELKRQIVERAERSKVVATRGD